MKHRISAILIVTVMVLSFIIIPNNVYAAERFEIQSRMISVLYGESGGRVSCDFDGYVNTAGRHEGIDFANSKGATIYSLINGTVINVEISSSGLSTVAIYDSENDKTVIYLHTANFAVSTGQTVYQGQAIATESNQGASAVHTHVEVRDGQRTHAAKSVNDYTLDNPNPYPYWESVFSEPDSPPSDQTIPDGDYWIGSAMDMNFFVDIDGVGAAPSSQNVWMWTCDNNMPTQYDVWTITYKSNGFYKIKQKAGDVCLEVANASKEDDANVRVFEDNDSIAQEWSIEETDNGYIIKARCNGYVLDSYGAVVQNGSNLMTHTSNDGMNQRFLFIPADKNECPLSDGFYSIRCSADTSFCLDGSGTPANYKSGTNVGVYKQGGDVYRLTYQGNGWYMITESVSGLALDVDNSGLHNFSDRNRNVMLSTKNGGRNQLWRIQKNSDGFYTLFSKISGYCLDLYGNKTTNGANVSQHPYNGSPAQKWQISPESYTLTVDPNGGTYDGKTTAVAKSPKLISGTENWWHIGESGNAVKAGEDLTGYYNAKQAVQKCTMPTALAPTKAHISRIKYISIMEI